ncbi:exodeoxyribonuclease V subunit alpha [Mycolicibacter terrae]|uniref:RecBCD enzyme subunit RecD n=2 Tax=Mycolicibacter TaxID=1073531 RepID=A0A1A2NXB2_MYCSD|nr:MULTISPECIES: exodeoxyribonuclease V subunit alpha [Mycolicibacter]OBH19707.1 exodeoxyribonuclease V subunit alpha [Mycolicibacter sinensis]OBI25909.1 exodeoxyribonuclease V subunit alpha [Mycolicibacter sinensis]RRR40177.1 exodeoxyribonuclease V subunit alpha [Mycolicibacter terrae]
MSLTIDDPWSCRVALTATGLLREFNEAGVLDAADVHTARRVCALGGEADETVALAVALAVRALRTGSVCVELATVAAGIDLPELAWPDPVTWLAAVRNSTLVTKQVLRLYADRLLYLDRYWREEEQVCADLLALSTPHAEPAEPAAFARLFPPQFREQRGAAEIALTQAVTVLTGGPGTGKTTTVARLLALLAEQAEVSGRPGLRIALAAPTGKAAARLTEAVAGEVAGLAEVDRARLAGLQASTLHSLLGARPGNGARFKHNRGNRLPHDVIVVDETSMVSLTMMARLLEAVRPTARLILVGDPDQLASVEAGAVLADLVDGLAARPGTRVATLLTAHRYKKPIGELAAAIRAGDGDTVISLLRSGDEHREWIDAASPAALADALAAIAVPHAVRVRQAALLGDAREALRNLDEHRLLCAHRDGPHGANHWNRQLRRWVSEQTGDPVWADWYAGRPLLITANDYGLGVRNGDTGVVVARNEGLRAVIATASGPVDFATGRLSDVDSMYAMTIHKSQGSEADVVTVLMPPVESRLLTRELFYTAVTRAKHKVRVVGSEEEIRAALDRRAMRASGLALRLREA